MIFIRYFASSGELSISSPFKMFFLSLLEPEPIVSAISLRRSYMDDNLKGCCWKSETTFFFDTAYSDIAPISPCCK